MSNKPQIFHGEWWVPAVADHNTRMIYPEPEQMMGLEKKYTGTLTYYGDKDSTLELYHVPSDFHSRHYKYNNVMWGKDANMMKYTLFNIVMQDMPLGDFTKNTFDVGLILIGDHVLSLDEIHFSECTIQFPYLKNWAFHNNLACKKEAGNLLYTLYASNQGKSIVEVEMGKETKWSLRDRYIEKRTNYDLAISQVTELYIQSQGLSLRDCIQQIGEFSQFLSIALYCNQNPTEIFFKNKEKTIRSKLLFKEQKSIEPQKNILIKFDELREKVPLMLKLWHENYERVSPISDYLIESLQEKGIFDTPDFLILAQALDGYFKRFVNKKNGKNIQKYEEEIKMLLKIFDDVEVVKKCRIKSKVLTDTRNKYSHLYPDEEKSLALNRDDLYWLTEKCKILLTCCILNMLGLTNKEINLCCEDSPISQIIDSFPLETD